MKWPPPKLTPQIVEQRALRLLYCEDCKIQDNDPPEASEVCRECPVRKALAKIRREGVA